MLLELGAFAHPHFSLLAVRKLDRFLHTRAKIFARAQNPGCRWFLRSVELLVCDCLEGSFGREAGTAEVYTQSHDRVEIDNGIAAQLFLKAAPAYPGLPERLSPQFYTTSPLRIEAPQVVEIIVNDATAIALTTKEPEVSATIDPRNSKGP